MHLETERLRLRPLAEADVAVVAQIWTDPLVTHYMGGPRKFEEVCESLAQDLRIEPPPRFDLWPVVEKASGQIVGHCGIIDKVVDDQPEFELVYVFAKSVWGQGYASEIAAALKACAFQQLGLARLVALVDPGNSASERVAVKVGMHHEKDTHRPGGKIVRVYVAQA